MINLAGPSAKFDSSGIPGIARIPPDSGRSQWRTIKTSMVEWLEEDGEDRPSSVDVWGFQKNFYTFADLKKWLAEQKSPLAADVEEQMDKKEKGKGGKKEKRKKPRK